MVSQTNVPDPRSDKEKRRAESMRGMLSLVTLLMSAISLGIALVGGAMVVFKYLENRDTTGLWAKMIALGLAYLVGWIAALVGIRLAGNLLLPYFVNVYAWLCLAGIGILYFKVISKLWAQSYHPYQLGTYIAIMIVGLIALIGLHLLLDQQNMIPFAIPLLIINLAQLYLIVYHYVFGSVVNYKYLWGDLGFFLFMTTIDILMVVDVGLLKSLRNFLRNIFKPDKPF
jgi:hypothetical protein